MRIIYNISKNKKIDYVKSSFFSFLLLAVALLFIVLGISNLSSKDRQLQQDKEKLDFYNSKLDEMYRNTQKYDQEIKKISRSWRNRVRLTNSLIATKTYDVIGKLDVIEKLLPYGVYIKDIAMRTDLKANTRMTLVANSDANLFEAYKRFSRFNPAIHNEAEDGGVYTAKISFLLKVAPPKAGKKPAEGKVKQEEAVKPGKKPPVDIGKQQEAVKVEKKPVVDKGKLKGASKAKIDKKTEGSEKLDQGRK